MTRKDNCVETGLQIVLFSLVSRSHLSELWEQKSLSVILMLNVVYLGGIGEGKIQVLELLGSSVEKVTGRDEI